ncbi:SMI1/KNR4 family protein [Priestia koreensis]|uniref:SMI1/KNR4 family protein n=1 Tax=Priestia koreensis TaxID=284581 RepID=UPI001F5A4765|nr:SMI1/KNR4 family protein [Priestia koreensis]UNL86359.1 SMI1/KNR4 family protein [Priestia koreensis]
MITFLQKYRKGINLLTKEEIADLSPSTIPDYWISVFQADTFSERKSRLLAAWNNVVAEEMSITISYLADYLVEIEMVEWNGFYSIIYGVQNPTNEVLYYEGRNPFDSFNNDKLKRYWSQTPASVIRFYNELHNGFYYYASESMGLVPVEEICYLDDYEWGIVDDLEKPLAIQFSSSFGFFANGMGDHVVIDYSQIHQKWATLWFHDDQPTYGIEFWDVIDEWTTIGFQV